jgi:hypothetical protein
VEPETTEPARMIFRRLLVTLMLAGACTIAAAKAAPGDDIAAVARYLKNKTPGAHWQAGPQAVSNAAVTAAYSGARRFYIVESSPPVPPGANIQPAVDNYQKAMKEYNSHHFHGPSRHFLVRSTTGQPRRDPAATISERLGGHHPTLQHVHAARPRQGGSAERAGQPAVSTAAARHESPFAAKGTGALSSARSSLDIL